MPLILRRAISDDAAEVAEVYLRSRNTLASYAPLAHSEAAVRDWVANMLVPSGNVTVAVNDNRIVGMAAHVVADGVAWLDQLYVHPEFQRQGVGSALLESVKSQTAGKLQLYTFQMNRDAAAFYERQGFVAIAYSDGSRNEEGCPDVLYCLTR
ncbi:MAG: N-acetyltransferase family protein [Burkholderia contaminans]|uniref:GNAT family N-acetyltransferase n=1 Tax=Burkholderia contaminans TaxID=488447 RepID=A0AAP4VH64_9BURK|nr:MULTISPECIES: GNAT family N-acetyltransferase [Burkholderia]MBD1410902.1 GNAT family N-acetyltransferase [Burkholderia contaminans]MBH9667269.1 GNAT family N-acetyltransferase [Burkholderia contaminans]MBH9673182.1 GNAT family N-acetyltransferase [Burkholderia contaminans]MBH9703225.1 GNAT family N-acetyltransferase [Burkholderia contaminans]MBH9721422.1 GNAT family N-acetyltransferase [Burkholderia contaminans]